MLNLNAEIYIQKSKLTFCDKYLINFPMASISFIYENIVNNLNMCNVLTLEETICVFYIKEIKLKDLIVIKEESTHFASRRGFCGGQER